MRNRFRCSAFAVMAVLTLSCGAFAPTTLAQGVAKSQTAAPADLTGIWTRSRRPPDSTHRYTLFEVTGTLSKDVPPMTAWGEEKFKAAKPNVGANSVSLAETTDPVAQCLPPGVPRIYTSRLGAPFEIMQVPGRVIMFFEYDHYVRQIYMDGRKHPPDLNPTWMGDSIGRWEGNTLVVDTVGFNDKTWLDTLGHPHSDALHLVERIRRVSRDVLTNDITIDDPKTYTKPWVAHINFDLKPDWKIEEYVCEDFLNFKDLEKISESPK